MASEIRVNQIQNRSGLSTVTFSDTGVIISGVTTISDLRTSGGALTVGTGASISSPTTNVLSLGTNNTEKVRIDSSGNFNLVNTAGIMTAFKYETPALINNHFKSQSTTAGAYVRMYAGASSGQWDIYGNGANLRFSDNASSGNIQMDRPLSMNSQNIIMSSGYGIDFSATANSSGTMTSELLDDYEEGTWSPTLIGEAGSNNPTCTYAIRNGRYVKIGQMVYASGNISLSAVSNTGTTLLQLGGWPFSVGPTAETDRTTVLDVGYINNWTTVAPNRGYLREGQIGSYLVSVSGTATTFIQTNYLQSNSVIYFKIIYTTSS